MKAKIKKFGAEVKEGMTVQIQIMDKLSMIKNQYKVKLGNVEDKAQLFHVKGEQDVIEFDAITLGSSFEGQSSTYLKLKVDEAVIHFLTNIRGFGITELLISLE